MWQAGIANEENIENIKSDTKRFIRRMRMEYNMTMLSAEEQALFGLGYYHQRNEFFKKSNDTADAGEASE